MVSKMTYITPMINSQIITAIAKTKMFAISVAITKVELTCSPGLSKCFECSPGVGQWFVES